LTVDGTSCGRDWNANCVGVWGKCKKIDLMYSTVARARRYCFAITENYGTRSSGRIGYGKEKSFFVEYLRFKLVSCRVVGEKAAPRS
jgi:hypothetical protein